MSYPIRFEAIFKERIWGGDWLRRRYGKDLPAGVNIGESWELVDLHSDCSIVANGEMAGKTLRELLEQRGGEFGFSASQCESPFGLLIKFLDARESLSVQVHPSYEAVKMFPHAALKTECWYILDVEEGGSLYYGLEDGVRKDDMARALKEGNVERLLKRYEVNKSDFFFIPSGTVHALGSGVLLTEIQMPSDTTYRLFDWNRVDSDGKSRQLHVTEAMESIGFDDGESLRRECKLIGTSQARQLEQAARALGQARVLADCDAFSVVHVDIDGPGQLEFNSEAPAVMIVLSGCGSICCGSSHDRKCEYKAGDTILLPKTDDAVLNVKNDGATEILLACLGKKP